MITDIALPSQDLIKHYGVRKMEPEGSYHDIADAWWAEFGPDDETWFEEAKEVLIKRLLDLWHR